MKSVYVAAVLTSIMFASGLNASLANAQAKESLLFENRSMYITHGGCRPSNQGDQGVEIWLELNQALSVYTPGKDLSADVYVPWADGPRICAELLSAFIRGERVAFRLGYEQSRLENGSRPLANHSSLLVEPTISPQVNCALYDNMSVAFSNIDSTRRDARYRDDRHGEKYVIGQLFAEAELPCGACGRQPTNLRTQVPSSISLDYPREVTFKIGGFGQTGVAGDSQWSFRILDEKLNARLTFRFSADRGSWLVSMTDSTQRLTTPANAISAEDVSRLMPILRANERCPATIVVDPNRPQNLRVKSDCNPYSDLNLRSRFG